MNFTKKIIASLRKNKIFLKRLLILSVLIFAGIFAHAQDTLTKTIFVEAGGNGGFASVNFDGSFFVFKNGFLSGRIGLGYFQGEKYFGNSSGVIVVPTIFNASFGKSPNWLETGFGLSLGVSTKPAIYSRITPAIGYRFQKKEKPGIFFRITYTPILASGFGDKFNQWAGISLGYSFL
jgi:hypothetical protein